VHLSVRFLSFAFILIALGCNGPFAVLPGGQLDGDVMSLPPDWVFAGDYGTIQLETRPEEPYSVNIAYTVIDGSLYINAGDTETQWVKNLAANPHVRMRMEGVLYELSATRISDAAEISVFGKAWTDQSMFRRDPVELDPVWIYRLNSR
jgi:hypothetical protein